MREPGESYEKLSYGAGAGQGNVHKDKHGGHSSPQKKGHSGGDEEGGHEGFTGEGEACDELGRREEEGGESFEE